MILLSLVVRARLNNDVKFVNVLAAGAGGGLLASQLSTHFSVLLIEAGGR